MASWQFEGMAEVYYPSGQLQARMPYNRGCLEGTIERFHPCGALASKEPFSGGLPEGVEQSWTPDGRLQSQVSWKGGERHGQSRQWHEEGSLFSDEWWDSGRLQSGAYFMADLPSGQSIGVTGGAGWRPQLLGGAVIQVSQFQAGRPQGWIRNYCRGALHNEWEVVNGQKNGLERFFDAKTGKIKLEMSWQDDALSGPCRSFFPSEKLESQWEMLDNQRHGRLVSWYRSGALMMIEDYERGRLVRGDYYEPGGGQPVSQVVNGNGTASLFLSDGRPSKVVAVQEGKPIP
jgi:antitoxin component YwqK of YwqJK toxin-antitoxin module